jgi:hypothetical protein
MPSSPEIPPGDGAWIELPGGAVHPLAGDCNFGRVEGNEIVVPDPRTSRRHAVVQRQGSRFVVVDLGSTNGTSLNARRVFKPTPLRDGDVIGIGGLRYVFHDAAGQADPGTLPPLPTSAAVGITSCWILLATAPESDGPGAAAWLDDVGRAARATGARTRLIRNTALLAHWREELAPAGTVRACVEGIAREPRTRKGHVAVHHGAVRVGPGAGSAEETLLGAAVPFVHNLEAEARRLGVPVLVSGAAAATLGLGTVATPLGPRAVGGSPGVHELFSLGTP